MADRGLLPVRTNRNIVSELIDRVAGLGSKPALVENNNTLTYAGLADRVIEASSKLRAEGVLPFDRVGLITPSTVSCVVSTLAILHAQAVAVPISPVWPAPALELIASRMRLHWALASGPSHPLTPARDRVREVSIAEAQFQFSSQPASGQPEGSPLDWTATNPAFIRFSSGTTGANKGVLLSHTAIAERIAAVNQGLGISENDVVLTALDMTFHFVSSILLFLHQGATIVLGGFDLPRGLYQAGTHHNATVLCAAPLHFQMLASAPAALASPFAASLRLALSTSASMSTTVRETFENRFGLPIAQAYGIIEVGIPCIDCGAERKPGSVGQPLGSYAVSISDPDDDGRGEVLVSGPGLFDAYFDPWRPRESILANGRFRTGDIGTMDENGFLHLHGRANSVINMAGLKVFPEEVEEVLDRHPAISEALVQRQAHPLCGEVPVALIVLNPHSAMPSERALRQHCRSELPVYMTPKSFTAVAELPRTASGKLLRH